MRILILGGTVFLGRHLVTAASSRGHEVTLFNRGQHFPDLFPGVEKLRGDRDGDLSALAGRTWDAVIDTSGYVPRVVTASASLLADAAEHYTFVSSISVYASTAAPGLTEDAPLATIDDPSVEEVTGETYGALKALCEQAAEAAMPGRTLAIRPGLIVGPDDPTGRFAYWPMRAARGGTILAPGPAGDPVQVIDVRDLAEWMVLAAERRLTGAYNATGFDRRVTWADLVEACCRAGAPAEATVVWVDGPRLLEAEVSPWSELPVWVPQHLDEYRGFMSIDPSRAVKEGLTFRDLEDTARATLEWVRSSGHELPPHVLTSDKEAAVLAAAV